MARLNEGVLRVSECGLGVAGEPLAEPLGRAHVSGEEPEDPRGAAVLLVPRRGRCSRAGVQHHVRVAGLHALEAVLPQAVGVSQHSHGPGGGGAGAGVLRSTGRRRVQSPGLLPEPRGALREAAHALQHGSESHEAVVLQRDRVPRPGASGGRGAHVLPPPGALRAPAGEEHRGHGAPGLRAVLGQTVVEHEQAGEHRWESAHHEDVGAAHEHRGHAEVGAHQRSHF